MKSLIVSLHVMFFAPPPPHLHQCSIVNVYLRSIGEHGMAIDLRILVCQKKKTALARNQQST